MQTYHTFPGETIPLGHRWEHYARRIEFDISAWVDAFGAGIVQLLHQRQGDEYPYPVAVTRTDADGETVNDTTGTLVFWDVTSTDTAQVCRYGKAELRYYRGTQVSPEFLAKSDIYRTTVENALGGALATAPEETPDWLATLLDAANSIDDRVSGAVSDARGYADAAQDSAETAQGYAQAAQQANANAAQEARTYAANAAQSATDARQAARDAASNVAGYVSDARSAANDAANSAQDAADYVADTQSRLENTEFLMGKFLTMDVSAQSLPSTSAASAQFGVSGDSPENLTISMQFGIPRGADGVSVTDMTQTVTSSESGGVNTVTVTLSDGTTRSFHVTNGARGDTGEPFRIAKTYASVAAMNADNTVQSGAFVVIASDTEDPDNAKLYVRGNSGFTFLTDLSGAQGIQGPAGADGVSVSTVTHTTDASGNVVVTLTLSNGNSSTFTIPKGDTGATGPQGPKGDTGETGTFSAADLQRITALESENALLRELVNGIDAPIYLTKPKDKLEKVSSVTFDDGYAANVKALSVTLTPSQSGTGDPSPDNVRPISGVTSVSVTRTGENGANSQTVSVTLTDGSNPLTVYGGTLNVTTGELTVTWKYVGISSAKWTYSADSNVFYSTDFSDKAPGYANIVSDTYNTVAVSYLNNLPDGCIRGNANTSTIYIRDDRHGGVAADFKAGATNTHILYELATPVTYQLTPAQIATLSGYNSVTTDAGTLSVTYRADPAITLGGD